MSTLLLRTMTLKSVIQAGKYSGRTVEYVISKDKDYLLYIYYNYNLLSFHYTILDELGISLEDRILKPGRNPELYLNYKIVTTNSTVGDRFNVRIGQPTPLFNATQQFKRDKHYFSKGNMQTFNHGR